MPVTVDGLLSSETHKKGVERGENEFGANSLAILVLLWSLHCLLKTVKLKATMQTQKMTVQSIKKTAPVVEVVEQAQQSIGKIF